MNYNKHDDTLSLSPCANQPLPEANLTDLIRNNSVDIRSIDSIVNAIYTHLYGKIDAGNMPSLGEPTCLRDEVVNQSHNLVAINEKLALICTKLGV